jgi:hypothetical protein
MQITASKTADGRRVDQVQHVRRDAVQIHLSLCAGESAVFVANPMRVAQSQITTIMHKPCQGNRKVDPKSVSSSKNTPTLFQANLG